MTFVHIGSKMAWLSSANSVKRYQGWARVSLATQTKLTMGGARCTYAGTGFTVCFRGRTTMATLTVKTNFSKTQTDCIETRSYLGPLHYGTI